MTEPEDAETVPSPPLIFLELEQEFVNQTGAFGPQDPLDTSVPLPSEEGEDPLVGNGGAG